MANRFCEALSEMLDRQVIKTGDNDPQHLDQQISPVRGLSSKIKKTSFNNLLYDTAPHVIRRRCKIYTRELKELCLAVSSERFPVAIYFRIYGWQIFSTLRSMLTFLDDLIQTEVEERRRRGISLYQESLLQSKEGGRIHTLPERHFSSHELIIL